MRAYQLHNASWSRIVTQRVRRPEAIADRLQSRRRPDQPIPADGQLVLLSCNHWKDPRTNGLVGRRELLDRIIEALSVPEIDGVVASSDLLEELTLLNVLEHRLAFCSASGDPYVGSVSAVGAGPQRAFYGGTPHGGIASQTIAANQFDGAQLSMHWGMRGSLSRSQPWSVAADVAELASLDLPAIVHLSITDSLGRAEYESPWTDWLEPLHSTASTIATGAGVWMSVPAISGLAHLAEATGFPILMRDTDVPLHPSAWNGFFEADLPMTIRGMLPGVSALFPLEGSVAEATSTIARSVRDRASKPQAA